VTVQPVEFLQMAPGEALDRLVAVEVVGLHPGNDPERLGYPCGRRWRPSTDPADALWPLLPLMQRECVGLSIHDRHEGRRGWFVTTFNPSDRYLSDAKPTTVEGVSLPHALCLAALLLAHDRTEKSNA
jgi:hypothetical protein